jgi:hypothetical protein
MLGGWGLQWDSEESCGDKEDSGGGVWGAEAENGEREQTEAYLRGMWVFRFGAVIL